MFQINVHILNLFYLPKEGTYRLQNKLKRNSIEISRET